VSVFDHELPMLDGSTMALRGLEGHAVLFVNVASKCGLTPQYEGLQRLNERFRERGLFVIGVPCNQFGGQEPLEGEAIAEFCATEYDVDFPLSAKLDVNGVKAHPLYRDLTGTPDPGGVAGEVDWNFEKFLVAPDGEVVARFRPQVAPDDPELVAAIEAALP
jgi:glutathione peroxidase